MILMRKPSLLLSLRIPRVIAAQTSLKKAFTRPMASRSYPSAIEHLNSVQSNASTIEAFRASGGRLSDFAIPEMLEYLGRIGYSPEDLNSLNVIHITGTKGKGSTCAFTDSILRQSLPGLKIGLYTSPHLVAVRERIRINGTPISEEEFTKYFFEVWDRLEANDVRKFASTPPKPMYFRFMTLVAFHAFLSMKVDATILEVGIGGKYDSTNIVPKPVVTGVTALGIDHTTVLGKTLKEIAWQKGGIYKEGVPALTVDQPEEGLEVLRQQAKDLKASDFRVVPLIPDLSEIKLGLAGAHQIPNANLAVHLAREFLFWKTGQKEDVSSPAFVDGLVNAKWPGRCQTVVDPNHPTTSWYLDGAHTIESLDCCMQWFVSPGVGLPIDASKKPTRILIFNCTSGRSGDTFLGSMLAKSAVQLKLHGSPESAESLFDHAIFCTNVTYADGRFKGDLTSKAIAEDDLAALKTQTLLAAAWSSLHPAFPPSHVHVLPSIEHAIRLARRIQSDDKDSPVYVLVAGSLHLVGGVIEVAGLSEVAL